MSFTSGKKLLTSITDGSHIIIFQVDHSVGVLNNSAAEHFRFTFYELNNTKSF